MPRHDAFLSYASEDVAAARELHDHLSKKGFSIWFAPHNLQVGDLVHGSLEEAMSRCYYGILLISNSYLKKSWTSHEMETFRRAAVERRKCVLPVTLGVSKDELEKAHPSLANVVMCDSARGMAIVAAELAGVLGRGAPTVGAIPSWMDPVDRFLKGHGEIFLHERDGPGGLPQTSTIWEMLAFPQAAEYPLYLDGKLYSRRHLLWRAAGAHFHNPYLVESILQPHDVMRLKSMFIEELPEYRRDAEAVANSRYPGDAGTEPDCYPSNSARLDG